MQIASSARWTGRLCASASLYTTTDWIPSSRQARMTRSAISPRLAIRILSKDRKRLLQSLRVGRVGRTSVGEDSLRETGQDVARAELDEGGRALPSRAPHRGDPLYWRPHLVFEQFREIGRMFVRFGVHVRDHGESKGVPPRVAQGPCEFGRRGAHRG